MKHISLPQLNLRQPGIKKRIKTGDSKLLYRNKLDKSCFTHNAAYSESKGLAKRNISSKGLKDRTYEITKNSK